MAIRLCSQANHDERLLWMRKAGKSQRRRAAGNPVGVNDGPLRERTQKVQWLTRYYGAVFAR